MMELPTLVNGRPIMIDEAWYTNPAYNFSQGQWIHNTNVGSGGDVNFIFPFVQGILFAILGYSIFLARFTSVLAGFFSIVVIFKILKQFNINTNAVIIGILALIAIPVYHSVFRYARPESWAILFVLLSLLYFIKYIQRAAYKRILFTGIFCALGFLAHPFTTAVSLSIGIILLFHCFKNKKIMPLILFTVPIIVSIVAFILNYIHLLGISGLNQDFGRLNGGGASFIKNISKDFKVIIDSYILNKNAIYFIPLFLVLLYGLLLKKKNHLAFQSSLMGIIVFCVSFVLFSSGGFNIILYYVFLFSILNFVFILNNNANKVVFIPIGFYLLIMLFANVYYDAKKYEPVNSSLAKELKVIIPKNAKVMGPTEFWMFLPETQFKSTGYRWDSAVDTKQLPAKFDYFLLFSEDKTNVYQDVYNTNQAFKGFPGTTLIYHMHSKNYGEIAVYSLKN